MCFCRGTFYYCPQLTLIRTRNYPNSRFRQLRNRHCLLRTNSLAARLDLKVCPAEHAAVSYLYKPKRSLYPTYFPSSLSIQSDTFEQRILRSLFKTNVPRIQLFGRTRPILRPISPGSLDLVRARLPHNLRAQRYAHCQQHRPLRNIATPIDSVPHEWEIRPRMSRRRFQQPPALEVPEVADEEQRSFGDALDVVEVGEAND